MGWEVMRNKRINRLLTVIKHKSSNEKIAELFGFYQELRGDSKRYLLF